MKTIEILCKYKDLADLVYKHVHALITHEVIAEFKLLKNVKCWVNKFYTPYPLLYYDQWDHTQVDGNAPCFNWRNLPVVHAAYIGFHISG